MDVLINYLPYLQIVLGLLLIAVILIQQNEAGLGSAFGGAQNSNPFATKRGAEKNLFIITIILAILFVASNLATLFF